MANKEIFSRRSNTILSNSSEWVLWGNNRKIHKYDVWARVEVNNSLLSLSRNYDRQIHTSSSLALLLKMPFFFPTRRTEMFSTEVALEGLAFLSAKAHVPNPNHEPSFSVPETVVFDFRGDGEVFPPRCYHLLLQRLPTFWFSEYGLILCLALRQGGFEYQHFFLFRSLEPALSLKLRRLARGFHFVGVLDHPMWKNICRNDDTWRYNNMRKWLIGNGGVEGDLFKDAFAFKHIPKERL